MPVSVRPLIGPALTTPRAFAQGGEPIKIGFGMALTGPLAANGKQALLGMQIWEEEINAKGGLLGRPVKLVYYDDQTNPSTVPGIYTKLIDVDKVDLVVGPYATNMIAPAMPVIMQKGKVFISLFGLAVNNEFNYPKYFSMIPTGQNTKASFTEGFFEIAAAQNQSRQRRARGRRRGILEQRLRRRARERQEARPEDRVRQNYPPSTTDFTPIVRAIQAANPDAVVICSYPLDSVGMVRAVNETRLQAEDDRRRDGRPAGDGVQGQAWARCSTARQLRDLGAVRRRCSRRPRSFFKEYQAPRQGRRRRSARLLSRHLGLRLCRAARQGDRRHQVAERRQDRRISAHDHDPDHHGRVKFGKNGEWTESGMMQVQYKDIKGNDLEQFRGMERRWS